MMDEPHMAAATAIRQLTAHLDELVRQRAEWETRWRREVMDRQSWQSRYAAVVAERDTARMERDVARAEANAGNMSP
jgi:hypothetical protein